MRVEEELDPMTPGEGPHDEGSQRLPDHDDLVDHFKIVRELGRGGMGVVYLARDTKLGRKVALKLVLPEALGNREALKRFRYEARVTAQFAHPHIVTIHAVGEYHGAPYVALEYLEGESLHQRASRERPSPKECMRHALAVAEALVEAHDHKVLHRDLKPENVILPRDGRLRVVDFGLAKPIRLEDGPRREPGQPPPPPADAETSMSTVVLTQRRFETMAESILGTPPYMAPEQWQLEDCTAATDIWALGVVLYELLTGSLPFQGQTPYEVFCQACLNPAPTIENQDDVPDDLAELVGRCLRRDPGERPSAREMVEVLDALLTDGHRRPASETSPFRGLRPFTEQHAAVFFGRDGEIEAFVERLREVPVLPVVGPSGAGKSSFVLAGVIPRLREQGRWQVAHLRPGSRPLESLAAQLLPGRTSRRSSLDDSDLHRVQAKADVLRSIPEMLSLDLQSIADGLQGRVLLLVDQLEELYTLVDDGAERRAFLDAICTAADDVEGPVRVVFTVRDDFLGRVAETASARAALGHITLLRSPDAEALRETLTRPLERVGYAFDDAQLPDEMVAAVAGEAASLPLLQFACSRLWDKRDRANKRVTREAYQAIGGVEGALATHADHLIESLTEGQASVARQMLLRLVTPEQTRKVMAQPDVVEGIGDGAAGVLDRLIQGRVVQVRKGRRGGVSELELVHESLITRWRQLQRWLEDSRDEVAFLAEVSQAADLWVRRGRLADEAWVGDALQDAQARARRCEVLPAVVAEFLQAGLDRQDRQRRRKRTWMWSAVAGLSMLALAMGLLATVARRAQVEERDQRQQAQLQRAEALTESAQSAAEQGAMVEARAKARTSLETFDSVRARALVDELARDPRVADVVLPAFAMRIAHSPDGALVAAGGYEEAVYVVEVATSRVVEVIRGLGSSVAALAFSPDGDQLYVAEQPDLLRVIDVADHSSSTYPLTDCGVTDGALSPSGRLLSLVCADATIRLWDMERRQEVRTLGADVDLVDTVAFSPDGRLIASGDDSGLRVWDVDTGEQLRHVPFAALVDSVCFDSTGDRLACSVRDGTLAVLDTKIWTTTASIRHGETGKDIAFSPDGRSLFESQIDGTVTIWDLETEARIGSLQTRGSLVAKMGPSPDGQRIAVLTDNQHLQVWDMDRATASQINPGPHRGEVYGVRFSPDGRLVASAGAGDSTVRLWDVSEGRVLRVLRGHGGVISGVSFSPDGRLLASAASDETVRLWDVASGRTVDVLRGHDEAAIDCRFSPDGRMLASSDNGGVVHLWDLQTGAPMRSVGHELGVNQVDFDPSGEVLATSSDDYTIRLWDVGTGRERQVLVGHDNAVYGARFGPDGRRLVSNSWDGAVRLWDLTTASSRVVGRCSPLGLYAAFHPSGDRVAATCQDGDVLIQRTDGDGGIVALGHRGRANDLAFDASGRHLVSSGMDSSVRVWDADTGRPMWHAPLLLHDPVEVYTHAGWQRLDGASVDAGGPEAWRRAVESRARFASQSPDGALLCIQTHGGELEAWDIREDQQLYSQPTEGIAQVVAMNHGCAVRSAEGTEQLVDREGASETIPAADRNHTADPSATAIGQVGPWTALGYGEGTIDLAAESPDDSLALVHLDDLPRGAVERIIPGPAKTLIAGAANGELGVWDLEVGARLVRAQLNGPVVHLLVRDDVLYAVSELGDIEILDLGVLTEDYCALMHEVWQRIPVVWEGGIAVVRDAPRAGQHRCADR